MLFLVAHIVVDGIGPDIVYKLDYVGVVGELVRAVCNFEEQPKPEDVNNISQYYTKAKSLKSFRQIAKTSSLTLVSFINSFHKNKRI